MSILAALTAYAPPSLPVFLDPVAFAIVGGGTLAATALRGPFRDTINAFRALRHLFGRAPFDYGLARAEIAGVERVTKTKSVIALDPATMRDSDVAAAIAAIADGIAPGEIEQLLGRRRVDRLERHAIVHDFWIAAAEAAPAMGMIGTLFGLVRMFRSMDDPATIGTAMAIALLATLYGALISNLIAGPIAARLRRASKAEEVARRALVKPLRAFALRETPTAPRREMAFA